MSSFLFYIIFNIGRMGTVEGCAATSQAPVFSFLRTLVDDPARARKLKDARCKTVWSSWYTGEWDEAAGPPI